MFGIFDNISEMPALVAELNRWGAQTENDICMLQETIDSNTAELKEAVLQTRGQVLTQGADTQEVANVTVRLNQRMEQIEDFVHDCVTKDRLREVVLASLSGAAEEKQE